MSAKKLQPVRGTHDCLPEESVRRGHIVKTASAIAERYGYGEISTPVFEFTEVFSRTLGETSDIVSKEMYSFEDRGGESITLRPEFTAGICRAFISGGLQQNIPLKLYASGPLFRYERPQKGRMRQFHQFDVECIGVLDPMLDAESIALGYDILDSLGIAADVKIEINSLGDRESRLKYREDLIAYLSKYKNDLSEDSKARLERNPLRILDSKDDGDRKIVAAAPDMRASFTDFSRSYFDKLQESLTMLGLPFLVNQRLVRGMDYYTHSVFEFTTDRLGAQATVLGGGRYDGLIGMMGGNETPAIGWAAGIERLEMLLAASAETSAQIAVIPRNDELAAEAFALARALRLQGFTVQYEFNADMKKRFARANKKSAAAAVIVADPGKYELKNMKTGEQQPVSHSGLIESIHAMLGAVVVEQA